MAVTAYVWVGLDPRSAALRIPLVVAAPAGGKGAVRLSCHCGRPGRGSISSRIAVLYSIVATTTAA
jgi:hypothetical protein